MIKHSCMSKFKCLASKDIKIIFMSLIHTQRVYFFLLTAKVYFLGFFLFRYMPLVDDKLVVPDCPILTS